MKQDEQKECKLYRDQNNWYRRIFEDPGQTKFEFAGCLSFKNPLHFLFKD